MKVFVVAVTLDCFKDRAEQVRDGECGFRSWLHLS